MAENDGMMGFVEVRIRRLRDEITFLERLVADYNKEHEQPNLFNQPVQLLSQMDAVRVIFARDTQKEWTSKSIGKELDKMKMANQVAWPEGKSSSDVAYSVLDSLGRRNEITKKDERSSDGLIIYVKNPLA